MSETDGYDVDLEQTDMYYQEIIQRYQDEEEDKVLFEQHEKFNIEAAEDDEERYKMLAVSREEERYGKFLKHLDEKDEAERDILRQEEEERRDAKRHKLLTELELHGFIPVKKRRLWYFIAAGLLLLEGKEEEDVVSGDCETCTDDGALLLAIEGLFIEVEYKTSSSNVIIRTLVLLLMWVS